MSCFRAVASLHVLAHVVRFNKAYAIDPDVPLASHGHSISSFSLAERRSVRHSSVTQIVPSLSFHVSSSISSGISSAVMWFSPF